MVDRNTKITSNQIADDTLLPTDLASTNSEVDNFVPSHDSATGKFTWIEVPGAVTTVHRASFTNADLVSGILTVAHSLNEQYVLVEISDNNNNVIIPDEITFTNTTSLTVDLTTFGTLAGTWNIVVTTGGASGASIVSSFTQSFTNATLSAGILTVTHSLAIQYVNFTIYNNLGKKIQPDDATATSTTVLTIDLTSFGTLSGTWNIRVIG